MVLRLTCSWPIDGQWLEPFVEAFCKNDSLDYILLHGGYVLVFCCRTFWRHVIGGENSGDSIRLCALLWVYRARAVHGSRIFRRFVRRSIFRVTPPYLLPNSIHTIRHGSCGTGRWGDKSARARRRSLRVRSAKISKNFPATLPQKLWTFRTSSRHKLKNSEL